jgi:hypothetical protein
MQNQLRARLFLGQRGFSAGFRPTSHHAGRWSQRAAGDGHVRDIGRRRRSGSGRLSLRVGARVPFQISGCLRAIQDTGEIENEERSAFSTGRRVKISAIR